MQRSVRLLLVHFPTSFSVGVIAAVAIAAVAGCGDGDPFGTAPVSGRLSYSDGSLVQADRITLRFIPQDIPDVGKKSPRAAMGEINIEDGTFSGLTTRKPNDGAIVGRHKVLVIATIIDRRIGAERLSNAISAEYSKEATTPLEVGVAARGKNNFDLVIEKGEAK